MKTVLEVHDIYKKIKGKEIIKGISFKVTEGQIYGFLGPNGAGKTMTLRMIVGLIKPTSGEVKICGHSVSKSFVKAMENVGCIIENPELYEYMSGYDNLKLLSVMEKGIDEDSIAYAIDRVGLSKRIHDKVSTYSLGMKQRLGIAQALMKKPKLLILDEPTNGLDPAGIKEFRLLIKDLALNHNMTIFVSSHLLSEIQMICDEVAIILHGKVIKTTKVEALLVHQKVYFEVDHVEKAIDMVKKWFSLDLDKESDHIISGYVETHRLKEINERLINEGIGLTFVSKKSKSLEDLFMTLTGGETIG